MLKAMGKFIDTLPLRNLFSQEERYADTVQIEVDRYYNDYDLAHFRFMMRGVTESGGETEALVRIALATGTTLTLEWDVAPEFTAEAGALSLDLYAYKYEDGTDPQTDPPDYLVRYQLPPVIVRGLPDNDHQLDSNSYTAFLLEVRATAENAILEIQHMLDHGILPASLEARIAACEAGIGQLRATAADHETRITALEQGGGGGGGTPIVILSQAQYDALTDPDEGTLYIIRDDLA